MAISWSTNSTERKRNQKVDTGVRQESPDKLEDF